MINLSFIVYLLASIAVDWINDKIYWSDENTSRIEVAELSGKYRKTLIETNLLHPRGLVADPTTRYLSELYINTNRHACCQ